MSTSSKTSSKTSSETSSEIQSSIVVNSDYHRYSLFPIKYHSLYNLYKKQRDSYWVPAEVDLFTDINEWKLLSKADQHFLLYTLAFFAQADGIVLRNLDVNFSMDIDIPEATLFYGIQAGIEAIHWEFYAILIDTVVNNIAERNKAFNAIENYPCIKKKAVWMTKWMDPKGKSYMERLVAFACIEGIFFSSAFASIFFFKKRGLMPGVTLGNKFIARDEGLHRDFGCELFNILRKEGREISDERVYEIVKDSVEIECGFVDESLNVELIGINKDLMKDYVKFVADHLLITLNLPKFYGVKNSLDWMSMISMVNKQNMFEGKISEYKKVQASTSSFQISDEF